MTSLPAAMFEELCTVWWMEAFSWNQARAQPADSAGIELGELAKLLRHRRRSGPSPQVVDLQRAKSNGDREGSRSLER